jgi:hypothetical protein
MQEMQRQIGRVFGGMPEDGVLGRRSRLHHRGEDDLGAALRLIAQLCNQALDLGALLRALIGQTQHVAVAVQQPVAE